MGKRWEGRGGKGKKEEAQMGWRDNVVHVVVMLPSCPTQIAVLRTSRRGPSSL